MRDTTSDFNEILRLVREAREAAQPQDITLPSDFDTIETAYVNASLSRHTRNDATDVVLADFTDGRASPNFDADHIARKRENQADYRQAERRYKTALSHAVGGKQVDKILQAVDQAMSFMSPQRVEEVLEATSAIRRRIVSDSETPNPAMEAAERAYVEAEIAQRTKPEATGESAELAQARLTYIGRIMDALTIQNPGADLTRTRPILLSRIAEVLDKLVPQAGVSVRC